MEVVTSGVVGDTESCIIDTDGREAEVNESVEDADEEDNSVETVDGLTFVVDVAAGVENSDLTDGDGEVDGRTEDIDFVELSEIQSVVVINSNVKCSLNNC